MEENEGILDILDAAKGLTDLMTEAQDTIEDLEETFKSEINLKTNYPYLIFKTEDLIRVMNLCNKIVQPKSDNPAYNTISIVPVPAFKTVNFYVTNDLSHFGYQAELIGESENMLDETISISFINLQKIVKLAGSKILIYKKDNNIYIRIIDGDLLVDYRQIERQYLEFPGTIKEKIAELGVNNIGRIVNAALPLLNAELRGDVKRVNFTGDRAYFNSSFYYLESMINSPKISLSLRDAEFFNKLYKYYKDKQIQIFKVESSLSRLYIKIDNISYMFINSINAISPLLIDQIGKMMSPIEALVNYDRLNKIVSLATMLPSSTGNVGLSYKDKKLIAKISSNKGESIMNFDTKLEKEHLYKGEIFVKAETLRKLLNAFVGSERIGIALSDLGITIENAGIKAVMMHTDI